MRERELKQTVDTRQRWCGRSLPMRERELKLPSIFASPSRMAVAPHAGARIETYSGNTLRDSLVVAPHAGARIETRPRQLHGFDFVVAPHAGARIETACFSAASARAIVAPHAGARIETRQSPIWHGGCRSLPMRERELKPASPRCAEYRRCRSPCGSAN